MFCPSCAAETQDDQRYCRKCGNDLRPDEPRRNRNPFGGIVPGVVVMMAGVIVGVIDKKAIHNDIISMIASIVAILGMAWIMLAALRLAPAAARFDRQLLSGRRSRRKVPGGSSTLPAAPPTNRLPSADHFEPVPSVVENTTDLLKQPRN